MTTDTPSNAVPEPAGRDGSETREWQWAHTAWGHQGAILSTGEIVWYEVINQGPGGMGGAASQPVAEFAARGPMVTDVPPYIIRALCQALRIEPPWHEGDAS